MAYGDNNFIDIDSPPWPLDNLLSKNNLGLKKNNWLERGKEKEREMLFVVPLMH